MGLGSQFSRKTLLRKLERLRTRKKQNITATSKEISSTNGYHKVNGLEGGPEMVKYDVEFNAAMTCVMGVGNGRGLMIERICLRSDGGQITRRGVGRLALPSSDILV